MVLLAASKDEWEMDYLKEQLRKVLCVPVAVALGLGLLMGIILGLPLGRVVDFEEVPGIGDIGCLKVVIRYDPGVGEYTPAIEILDKGQGIHFEKQFATRVSKSGGGRKLEWVFHDIPTGKYQVICSSNGEAFPDWASPVTVEVRAYSVDNACPCIYFDYLEKSCGPCPLPNGD